MGGSRPYPGRCYFPRNCSSRRAQPKPNVLWPRRNRSILSLTTPEAIVSGLHSQPQLREMLRPILTPRHPSQIYEALLEGVFLFTILWLVRTRTRQPDGVLTGLFFLCYAIFRIVAEYFREPDASLILGFTRGQFFSFFLIAIGLAFIIVGKIRNRHAAPIFQTAH